jgi:hypothetical protein
MVLGYTRTGKTVQRPSHDAPDDSAVQATVPDWGRGDHVDASRIFAEHSDRETDREIAAWCVGWAAAHRHLGGR